MYIKRIKLSNFQVIEDFEGDFEGGVYLVTGDNELGKSTLLKAIGALLTGQRDEVLRRGSSKGYAKMVVGDDGEEYEVSLSFSEANPRGTLSIKQKSTGIQSRNVSFLQQCFGYQDFDAVEFSRWSETAEGRRRQIEVIKSLLPEGVRARIEEIDGEVAALRAERTDVSRDARALATLEDNLAGQLEEGDVDKYNSPMDMTYLMEKQKEALELDEKARKVRGLLEQRTNQLAEMPSREQSLRDDARREEAAWMDRIAEQERILEELRAEAEESIPMIHARLDEGLRALSDERMDLERRKSGAEEWLSKYEQIDPYRTDSMIREAEHHNRKYHLVQQYLEKASQRGRMEDRLNDILTELETLSGERSDLIQGAGLPVQGLSFTEDGLILNGIPFSPGNVSDSQAMEVAAKLVMAANPRVKVFRIARGESLGSKRLRAIVEMASRNGFQGFIEQVERGQEEMMVEEYTEDVPGGNANGNGNGQ